jgi:predicted dehydrogenase
MSSADSNDRIKSSRRQFLRQTAAVTTASLAAGGATASAARKSAPTRLAKARIIGANDRINVGFIGCGMQFLGLLSRAFDNRKKNKNDFDFAAVCDVWEPRLKHGQERTKAAQTFRDYRELIARSDIDGVVIAVPDHWHFAIAREACLAGKDVYLEKPMTYTVDEAARLNDIVGETGRVLQVGGSGVTDDLNHKAAEYIRAGKMGKVLWGLISYNRNTTSGMWDYPIPGVGEQAWPEAEVSPRNLDWKMWLGPAPKRAFSKERYFRWRKFWDYSGGNATDLLYHRLGAMSTILGFDFPTRVVGAGGIYVQKNREVPDTYMTIAEYPGDYCINMISCMANAESAPVSVFGNWGTLQIVTEQLEADPNRAMGDNARAGQRRRARSIAVIKAERTFSKQFQEANEGKTEVRLEPGERPDLVDDWLDCMRSRNKPVYDVLKGYQVMVAIKLGVDSYKQGRVLAFDPATRRILKEAPARKVYLPVEET